MWAVRQDVTKVTLPLHKMAYPTKAATKAPCLRQLKRRFKSETACSFSFTWRSLCILLLVTWALKPV